jgi:hypothetical protein
MIIEAYLPPQKAPGLMHALQTLPAHLRPSHFTADEQSGKAKGRIGDEAKFKKFVAANECGFFLLSDRARYNINLRPKNGFCRIEIDSIADELSEGDAVAILRAVARAGAVFAFAADQAEYNHRNRYVRTLGSNQFEAWIGRDLSRYLPGFYWLTVLSKQHSDVLSKLSDSLASTVTELDSDHWLIKAFENQNDWKRHASRLDEWIAREPEVFSKSRVVAQLDAAPDIGALSELAGAWR